MKAIVIHQAGDAQQLQIEERPIPALKEGWTLVKVKGLASTVPRYSRGKGIPPQLYSRVF